MHPALSRLERELTAAIRGLNSTETQLRLPHNPTSWNIHQIVQHLTLTYASSVSSFEARLAKNRPIKSRPTAEQRLAKFVVVTLGLMPGRRLSPPEVAPANSPSALSGEALALAASSSLSELDDIATRADQAFGTAPCLTHFALGPLSASEWRRFHLCHGRHHIRQILAIRRANGR
jgi:hypothetical protein